MGVELVRAAILSKSQRKICHSGGEKSKHKSRGLAGDGGELESRAMFRRLVYKAIASLD